MYYVPFLYDNIPISNENVCKLILQILRDLSRFMQLIEWYRLRLRNNLRFKNASGIYAIDVYGISDLKGVWLAQARF
jgi:hypothetical protein